jgi:hypothetical protein
MKHIGTSLLASCLIANLGLVVVAQTSDTTTTTSSSQQTTTQKKGKHHGFRKHSLKKLFKKSEKTDSTTTK